MYSSLVQRIPWTRPSRAALKYIVALAIVGSGVCGISIFLLLQEHVIIAASALVITLALSALIGLKLS